MAFKSIQLTPENPHYKVFTSLDTEIFGLEFKYNYRSGVWSMDVMDGNENILVSGVPILLGVGLLNRFKMDTLPKGTLFVQNFKDANVEADISSLGDTVEIIYIEA